LVLCIVIQLGVGGYCFFLDAAEGLDR